jgi:hypothetical protein
MVTSSWSFHSSSMDIGFRSLLLTIPSDVFLKWRASVFGGTQISNNHRFNAWLLSE